VVALPGAGVRTHRGGVGRRIRWAGDFAGRFGGEDLLVLLPDTPAGDAVALAERIRATVAAITVLGVEGAITVSIGVADLIQHGGDAAGLLRQADRALYAAKAMGRNRVMVAGADDQPGVIDPTGERDRADPDADLEPDTGRALA
jgi:predicted signal transduction protein with EAL and GGDEF domain